MSNRKLDPEEYEDIIKRLTDENKFLREKLENVQNKIRKTIPDSNGLSLSAAIDYQLDKLVKAEKKYYKLLSASKKTLILLSEGRYEKSYLFLKDCVRDLSE